MTMTMSAVRRWRPVFVAAAIPVAAAILAALLAQEIYRAQVLMVPVIARSEQQSAGAGVSAGLSSIAAQFGMGSMSGAADAEQEAIATLTARSFVEAFISERNLLPILFEDEWNEHTRSWASDKPEDVPTLGDGYRYFVEDIVDVNKDLRSGLVTLTVDWRDRNLAAEWATDLVGRINERMRQRAIQEAQASLQYLSGELAKDQQMEVRQAIYRILEWNMTQSTLANVHREYAFRVIDPAVAADDHDYIRPRRLVILMIGVLLGSLLGIAVASFKGLIQISRLYGDRS